MARPVISPIHTGFAVAPSIDTPDQIRAGANRLLTDPEWRRRLAEAGEETFWENGHVWGRYLVASEDLIEHYTVEVCPATGEMRCGCRWRQFHDTCKHGLACFAIKDGTAPTPPQMLPGLEAV